MEPGEIGGAWGRALRGATIDWIPLDADGQPGKKSFWGFGENEELAPHPSTNFSPSPTFQAARCMACRLVVFWF